MNGGLQFPIDRSERKSKRKLVTKMRNNSKFDTDEIIGKGMSEEFSFN